MVETICEGNVSRAKGDNDKDDNLGMHAVRQALLANL